MSEGKRRAITYLLLVMSPSYRKMISGFIPLLISVMVEINHSLRLMVSSGQVVNNADVASFITCTSPGLADGLLITIVLDSS